MVLLTDLAGYTAHGVDLLADLLTDLADLLTDLP